MTAPRTILLTSIAMVAFAANSILCRLALAENLIDAASFTVVRAISGAATLALIVLLTARSVSFSQERWVSGALLFAYMAGFSFAYISLSAGTGALILFGAVQLTMFIAALREGERFSPLSWAGLWLAVGGLMYLVFPGVTAPDPAGAVLMAIAGISWGFYSLLGRGSGDPVAATASNFICAAPLALCMLPFLLGRYDISVPGATLAVASGAITSACGYAIWFAALKGLTAARAATVQLSVPAIAALAGVLLLSEEITLRLLLAAAATLGGVAVVLAQRSGAPPAK